MRYNRYPNNFRSLNNNIVNSITYITNMKWLLSLILIVTGSLLLSSVSLAKASEKQDGFSPSLSLSVDSVTLADALDLSVVVTLPDKHSKDLSSHNNEISRKEEIHISYKIFRHTGHEYMRNSFRHKFITKPQHVAKADIPIEVGWRNVIGL